MILEYNWPGNIRELKNFVQNISVLEKEKNIDYQTVSKYLPKNDNNFHIVKSKNEDNDLNEREILYKVLFDMKRDLNHLKKVTDEIILKSENSNSIHNEKILNVGEIEKKESSSNSIENTLSLFDNEKNLIIRALKKNFGKRKNAAKDLGISERTLYRKIKEFNL